jgi:hypothetical protein
MQDHELKQAHAVIPVVLDSNARQGHGPLSAPELVNALQEQGIGEEATRLAMWSLIDRGAIELTADWWVQPRQNRISAS